jgi:hypothetical protein
MLFVVVGRVVVETIGDFVELSVAAVMLTMAQLLEVAAAVVVLSEIVGPLPAYHIWGR